MIVSAALAVADPRSSHALDAADIAWRAAVTTELLAHRDVWAVIADHAAACSTTARPDWAPDIETLARIAHRIATESDNP